MNLGPKAEKSFGAIARCIGLKPEQLQFVGLSIALVVLSNSFNHFSEWLWNRWLGQKPSVWMMIVLIGVLLLVLGFVFAVAVRNAPKILASPVRTYRKSELTPRKVLVMGFSPRDRNKATLDAHRQEIQKAIEDAGGHVAYCQNVEKFKQAWDAKNPGTGPPKQNWQQNFRAVFAHRDTVESILILPPNDDVLKAEAPGAQSEFDVFCDFMRALCGTLAPARKVDVGPVTQSADDSSPFRLDDVRHVAVARSYDDYAYCYSGFALAIAAARSGGVVEKEIIIDITAGFKVFSIAGAVATMNSDVVFQYISIAGDPVQYDTSIIPDPGPGI